jgi:hypothetical protein
MTGERGFRRHVEDNKRKRGSKGLVLQNDLDHNTKSSKSTLDDQKSKARHYANP